MSSSAAAHYETLLAEHYTWMLGGDLERVVDDERRALVDLGITPGTVAVDLGCGPGTQTLALADMGFARVVAVDTNQALLDELETHARSRPAVRTVRADLVEALADVGDGAPIDVVVCMGDSIAHLDDLGSVRALARRVGSCLTDGGRFVVTFRDLTTPLVGPDRFLPVRTEDDRIMLCALEYPDRERVTVTDVVYSRGRDGWTVQKSSYDKLRLSPDRLRELLTEAGLAVTHQAAGHRGMWSIIANAAPKTVEAT